MARRDEFTDQLSAYLDEELSAGGRARLEEHLAGCAECRAVLTDLRAIVAAAPRYEGREPEADLWPAIAARLDEPGVVPLPAPRADGARAPGRTWRRFSLPELVAASVVMAALGAGGAWLGLRGTGTGPAIASTPVAAAPDSAGAPLRAVQALLDVEQYDAAVSDLEQVLAQGRTRLDTATVRVIDESLRRIDGAIQDARAAIQRDPANAYLTRQIAANMRRKLDLLRTAAKAIAEL